MKKTETKYTYSFSYKNGVKELKIQLIKVIYPDLPSIINYFDTDCCCIVKTIEEKSKYYTNERGLYALKTGINMFNFRQLSNGSEYRFCKYCARDFGVFIPFYKYFYKYMKKDFTDTQNLKGCDIISNYIVNGPPESWFSYYEKTVSESMFRYYIYNKEFLNDCFGKKNITDLRDWYPEFSPEIKIPNFNYEILKVKDLHIEYNKYRNVKYDDLVYYGHINPNIKLTEYEKLVIDEIKTGDAENQEYEEKVKNLLRLIKEKLVNLPGQVFLFGNLVFQSMIDEYPPSGPKYLNLVSTHYTKDQLESYMDFLTPDEKRHVWMIFHDKIDDVKELFEYTDFEYEKFFLTYENRKFVYYTNDKQLWFTQNRITTIDEEFNQCQFGVLIE